MIWFIAIMTDIQASVQVLMSQLAASGKNTGHVIQWDTVATHPVCIDFPSKSTVQYPEWQLQEMTAYHAKTMVMRATGGLKMGLLWIYSDAELLLIWLFYNR